MNNTKQKIIQHSLVLFNENGISKASLRDIAKQADISVGNLQYHFKKREDIVELLYFELVDKLDNITALKTDDILKSFINIGSESITIFYDYRFFFLDFISIIRQHDKIKNHYSELSKHRKDSFLEMIDMLIDHGLFRKEELKGEYQSVYKRIEVISNFWFSSILIQSKTLSKKAIDDYSLVISQSVYPYLTEEGRVHYKRMFNEQVL
ncbi:TetR/AcrR family transcriptional regulator [Flammeovirga pacifica]|uniref:HTH tetR-type domain-containing protein n=1 Tax=Flammeovirga pacifica TaxID=915059 RepID=A0A1S1Z3K2_FLAPC|nr:TetR/AcrR family transcriptional regulator [Flammeovirga pacifica]OHX67866.1 hypothetical protein NH26_16740 [Flammeovirga pacifica]